MVGFTIPVSGVASLWHRIASLLGKRSFSALYSSDAGVQTLATRLPLSSRTLQDFSSTTTEIAGLTKTEAEDLLDWLESNDNVGWELATVRGTGFVVRRK